MVRENVQRFVFGTHVAIRQIQYAFYLANPEVGSVDVEFRAFDLLERNPHRSPSSDAYGLQSLKFGQASGAHRSPADLGDRRDLEFTTGTRTGATPDTEPLAKCYSGESRT